MMAPKVGDVVFVATHNEYDSSNTVVPAIVTYVLGESDGDPRWWEAAREKEIVQAIVFGRDGTTQGGVFGKTEQVTVDDGEGGTLTYPVGYSTTVDGHGDVTYAPAQGQSVTTRAGAPATAQGLSDADISRLAAALRAQQDAPAQDVPAQDAPAQEPTQTVGDGADVATPIGGAVPAQGDGEGFPAP